DEVKSNRETTLSESHRKNNSINETPSLESGPVSPDASTNKKDANKQKENSESSDEDKKMSLKKQDTEAIGDTEINGRNDLNEAIAESKKLKEKMSKINRSSLEKIRDKVLK
ncbi:MAG: hypothetical protein M3P82_06210, partial [Bacteroidota bacterium]|nr:hypothetical protein [Bacteroidota bacterium]